MNVLNIDIVKIFDKIGDLLELEGANPFRIRAYHVAARTIEGLPKSITEMIREGFDLTQLPGIGKDLAGKIQEIVKTGTLKFLDELEKKIPKDLLRMRTLQGLGPKRIQILHKELGINSFKELEESLKKGEVRKLKGFGEKTQEKILSDISRLKKSPKEKSFTHFELETTVNELIQYLKEIKYTEQVEVAGSFRRKKEIVGDLDILVTGTDKKAIIVGFLAYPQMRTVIAAGETRATVVLINGLQIDLRVVKSESFGSALHYFTGSKDHNIAVRKLAISKGLKVNEYGIYKADKRLGGESENDVFSILGLDFIAPELRENLGEISAAANKNLPHLITLADIRGDLHGHTKETDGINTLEEMIEEAQRMNYEYMAITDHSKRVTIANGLDEKRLSRQIDKIDHLNSKLKGFTILKGIEVDILPDGSLDLPASILKRLDIRVCAIHYNQNMSKEGMTSRILKAMDNPYFNILAHPSGRLINKRLPYKFDIERVLIAAKERGCFLELNSQPQRLDLTDLHCKMAKEIGVKLAISSDSHSRKSLSYMRLGINQARRGWIEKEDVINTLSLSELKKVLKR